ncbi:MAG: nitroreductase family protein [Limnochordia bacterium]|nr:nitroreductase family protein [Limnochordia bacterium]
MLIDLMKDTRSFRRFKQEPAPTMANLISLIDIARLTPSTANRQPLKYVLVKSEQVLPEVFSCLTWAGYLKDWDGPSTSEQPSAYIVILSDSALSKHPGIDVGLAAQSILLGAQELGFGACLLAAIDRPRLGEVLDLPENLEIQLVVALGTPGEEVRLASVGDDGSIRYYRDEQDVHFVPKRSRDELIEKTL